MHRLAKSQVHAPRTISLLCWILGVSHDSLGVDIKENLQVSHLKEEILKKRPFPNVHPDQLQLWRVRGRFFPLSSDFYLHLQLWSYKVSLPDTIAPTRSANKTSPTEMH
jgi:hypothetical protein